MVRWLTQFQPICRQRCPPPAGRLDPLFPRPWRIPGAAPDQKAGPDTGKKSKEFDNHALDQIAARLVSLNSRLAISHDSVIQRFIYKFVNPDNGKVVQQYPQQMTLDSSACDGGGL